MSTRPAGLSEVRLRTTTLRRTFVAAVLAVTLIGCGKSNPSGPSGNPYEETLSGNVVAYGFSQRSFTPPRAGQMRAVLSWPNGNIDLDLYLTDSACDAYPPLHCSSLANAATASGTSETITYQVPAGQSVKLWVDNFDFALASDYTIQLTIQ